MKAEVFLNFSPNAKLVGYRGGDLLRNVYHLEVDATKDATVLDKCFQIFTSRLPRNYHVRPLSVGDVIRLDGARMWARGTQGWSRLREAERHVATTSRKWYPIKAKLNPPHGASKLPCDKPSEKHSIKNKMSNDEAINAMKILGHDFSGHEDQIKEILNKVRRDEWHAIVDHYEH